MKMDRFDRLKIIAETEDTIVFDFEAPVQEANRLRQILLSEIPCMAVDKVIFSTNTSVATNEYIAHRLGLIPIKVDARKFKDMDTFLLHLEAKGEEDEKNHITTVYSSDITGDYLPVHKTIPIIKLAPNQEIKAIMKVKKGIGAQNAKWQVTSPVGFHKQGQDLYRLTVESTGVYTPMELLEIGMDILESA